MNPITRKSKKGYCLVTCPHMQRYIHPFFCHSAWCNHTLRNLSWYDGAYIAQCEQVFPEETASKLVKCGWKGNPEYVKEK